MRSKGTSCICFFVRHHVNFRSFFLSFVLTSFLFITEALKHHSPFTIQPIVLLYGLRFAVHTNTQAFSFVFFGALVLYVRLPFLLICATGFASISCHTNLKSIFDSAWKFSSFCFYQSIVRKSLCLCWLFSLCACVSVSLFVIFIVIINTEHTLYATQFLFSNSFGFFPLHSFSYSISLRQKR